MRERQQRSVAARRAGDGERGTLGPWLIPAAALHAALLLLWLTHRSDAAPPPRASPAAPSQSGDELSWVELAPHGAVAPTSADVEPFQSGTETAPSPRRRPALAATTAAKALGPASLEPSSPAASPEVEEPAIAGDDGAAPAAAEPRLSLDDLGIGARSNRFLGPPPAQPLRSVLNQRVQQMLKSGLAARDQEVGLGPEGPAVALAEKIVLDSATRPNTSALLLIRTDGSGITSHVEVLDAENESQGWQRIAEELKRELAKRPLRVPNGSAGVSFTLRVTSRVQLPSGADPGLAVELFGQTVKEGGGDRSSRISILSPKVVVTKFEVPYSDGATIPMLGFSPNILGIGGDLADIGAVARRVVRAHLVALETHVDQAEPK